MDCFNNFDPLTGDVPGYPFFELWKIVSDTRILLDGLSTDDILEIERNLDGLIYDVKFELGDSCLDEYVKRIIEDGSWELQHLPLGTAPTEQSVKRLLENWPENADEPEYLTEDDWSDIEVLRMVISSGGTDSLGFESSDPVKYAAVLALMKVAECLNSLNCPEDELGTNEDGPIAARLVSAANEAIEAALALGFAKELDSVDEGFAEAVEDFSEKIKEKQLRFSVERARKAATARHEHFKPAILFVQSEWNQHHDAYKCNKTDFARTYVELVRNKFRDRRGDPLKVTGKTITDVWLAPSASKKAGMQAAG